MIIIHPLLFECFHLTSLIWMCCFHQPKNYSFGFDHSQKFDWSKILFGRSQALYCTSNWNLGLGYPFQWVTHWYWLSLNLKIFGILSNTWEFFWRWMNPSSLWSWSWGQFQITPSIDRLIRYLWTLTRSSLFVSLLKSRVELGHRKFKNFMKIYQLEFLFASRCSNQYQWSSKCYLGR